MRCKFFLSGVLFLLASFSLHAAENCHCGLDSQSTFIYIAENAKVYNPDLIFAKQTDTAKNHKAAAKVEKKAAPAPAAADRETVEQTPMPVVLPAIPLATSSSFFLQGGSAAAAISPQRTGGDSQSAKTNRENVYSEITKSDLSLYHPKQKQKLSPAATQCGMLTSFASTSPPTP